MVANFGCRAHVEMKAFTLYPEYSRMEKELNRLSKWKRRIVQESKIKVLRDCLQKGLPVKTSTKYWVSLPQVEEHSGHPIEQGGIFA